MLFLRTHEQQIYLHISIYINNYIVLSSIHIIRIPLATALTTHKSPKSIIRITLFSFRLFCVVTYIYIHIHHPYLLRVICGVYLFKYFFVYSIPYIIYTQNTIFILCSDLPDFLSCVLVLSLFYICNWKSHPCLLIHFQTHILLAPNQLIL